MKKKEERQPLKVPKKIKKTRLMLCPAGKRKKKKGDGTQVGNTGSRKFQNLSTTEKWEKTGFLLNQEDKKKEGRGGIASRTENT